MIPYGNFKALDEKNPSVFAYEREYQGQNLVVACNFYGKDVKWDAERDLSQYQCLLSNYGEQKIQGTEIELKPYEAVVLYKK